MLPMVPTGRSKTERQIVNFLGLNYGEGWRDGELLSCKNLSSRKFPALTQRGKRETLDGYTAPSALYSWNGLVAVDGTDLKIDGETVATVATGEKQFAVVNTKLCVFPDKIYVDLTNNEVMSLEASVTSTAATTSTFTTSALTISVPEVVGEVETYVSDRWKNNDELPDEYTYLYIRQYDTVSWNDTTKEWTVTGAGKVRAYTAAAVGKYIMLKKTDIPTSYVINTQTEKLVSGATTVLTPFSDNNDIGLYAKILEVTTTEIEDEHSTYTNHDYRTYLTLEIHDANYADGTLTKIFTVGCPVTITGADTAGNNVVKKTLLGVTDTTLTFSDSTFTAGTQTAQITVSRVFPDLDYVCESKNRLWGVCKADNSIYASALGDPTNFYLFGGTSLDSYTVAVGSEGDFTGICKYDQSVLCFKENALHRVYGDYPAEYSVVERPMFGVRDGAAASLVSVGGVLYYLGRDGVYVFSGNMPSLVSEALGEKRFSRCYAGSDGDILYMSMKDEAGAWGLYSYDTRKGIWLMEDDTFALSFATVDGHLYFVNGYEAYTADDAQSIAPSSGTTFDWTEGATAADFTFTNATGPVLTSNMTVTEVSGTDTGDVERTFDATYTGIDANGNGLWTLVYHGTGDSAVHSVSNVVMEYTLSISEGGNSLIKCDSTTSTEKVEWEAEFTPFDETTIRRKSPSRLSFRCELEAGSWVSAYISCDGEPYRLLYTSSDDSEPTIVIPVAPRRCDSYKVKLVGKGGCVIRAAERTFRVGSDWR